MSASRSDRADHGRAASYLDAAVAVLEAIGRPLTAREITDEALRRGLIRPAGKTPEATMTARLYVHARDDPTPRVVRLAEPGPTRARRNSVRWALAEASAPRSRC
ncbi:MAG: winged helix-turn-helix domain-containing protein [Chloroflexi bacterium]|nr:winged helix-turn-helix domain-containing protein [Chloroflexota bacterium]